MTFSRFYLNVLIGGAILVGIGHACNAKAGADGWDRSYSKPVQQVPVEQQGLTPAEFADLKTVKVLSTYRVQERFAGLAYYDKATDMVCHVVTDATLLNPKAIDCEPYKEKK